MGIIRQNRGPVRLYPLPGTEEYVKKLAKWFVINSLKEIRENGHSIADYFMMEDEDIKELEKHMNTEESLQEFLAAHITGTFRYFCHRNGAIEVSIGNSARTKDIYIFHTFSEADVVDFNGKERNLNLSDQELLLYNTLDAFLESKTEQLSIFELNLGQARSDRPKGRGSCNLRTFFRNITANGANHLFMYQIHSKKSLIGIDNTKTTYDNFSGESLLKKHILRNHVKTIDFFRKTVQEEWIVSSVDAGGKAFAAKFAKSFKAPLLVVDKRRNALTNEIDEITILKPESLSVKDKIVFIVDDMIDSGGSIVDVCRKYKELGAREINVAVVYGLFSPPAEERLNNLRKEGALNKVIVTNLVTPGKDFLDRNPFIEVADTTYSTARIIQRHNQGRSLEKYFLPINAEEYLLTKVENLI